MAILPRPSFPVYEITIPSTKKKVKYRPYLSKEEKVLSIAMESEDITEISNAIKLILQNCIQSKDIDVEKLATFDIEYLYLNIRAKAVGEELELNVLYPSDDEDEEPVYVPVKISISDIKVQETKGHSNVIKIDDTMSMIMRYPTFEYFIKDQFEMPQTNKEKYEKGSDLIASCVDKICKDEEVWLADDVGKEEVLAFLDDLTSSQFSPIQEFLESMPQLKHKIKIKHPETEVEKEVTLSGIVDFFI
jgi:hypothetical protein